jgi:hypothetical protein
VLGLYPRLSAAATLLSCAMFVTAASFSLLRWYATRHARLFRPDHEAEAAAALRRSYVGPALYFLAILAAQVAVPISIGIQIAVPLLFFVPVRQGTGRG